MCIRDRGASVPFVGLAEAYIVAAFTRAGVPVRRIRPAVLWLQEHIGLPQALASRQLQADGAEVLWDFGRQSGDPPGRARLPDDGHLRGRLDAADPAAAVREGRGHRRPVAERRPAVLADD